MARSSAPLWLATSSRFVTLSRHQARLVLLLLAGLLLASLLALCIPEPPRFTPIGSVYDDWDLYEVIRASMQRGTDYYTATATALRSYDYPLRPFVTFRLPTLAWVRLWFSHTMMLALLYTLVLAVALAWAGRLAVMIRPARWRLGTSLLAILLFFSSTAMCLMPGLLPHLLGFHEIWAGLCVALSLALWRPGRWGAAVAFGLIAMLIRETAALYVGVMALLAWQEGRQREASGWALVLGVFAMVLAFHAEAVWRVTNAHDPHSPGWNSMLGFGFFVYSMTRMTVLTSIAAWLTAPLVALALFGWACWNSPLGLRMSVMLTGYIVLIGCCARLDTFYWAMMVAPVFLLGLLFVPNGLYDLFTAAFARQERMVVQRVGDKAIPV